MENTKNARTASRLRIASMVVAVAAILGVAALVGCSGQANATSEGASADGSYVVSASHEAGVMTMPADHYANVETLELNNGFTQCSECHEGIDDFVMDGENDLLSKHVVAFEDTGDEVDCVLCHDATVNGTSMTFEELDNDGLCMGCHNIDEVAEATENWNNTGANPHKLNHGVFECTNCHSVHTQEQTYYCNKCHHFELPDGWVSPEYITDTPAFQSFE